MQLPPSRLHRFLSLKTIPSLSGYLTTSLKAQHLDWCERYVQGRNQESVDAFRIDFNCLQKELGYTYKHNAKRLLEKLVVESDYVTSKGTSTGGRPEEIVLLTLRGAQKFCLISGTTSGREMAETLLSVLEAVADYSLLTSYMESRQFQENLLVEQYPEYPVVYLADVFHYTEEGLLILKKVGYSKNVRKRQDTLSSDMRTACYFTHVFRCIRNFDCEQAVLKDPLVTEKLFKICINGHVSTETLQLDTLFSEQQLEILVRNKVKEYNICADTTEDVERLKLLASERELEYMHGKMRLVEQYVKHGGTIPISLLDVHAHKNSRAYKVQQIAPEDLTRPVAVFESPVHVTREVTGASRARLKIAMTDGIMYMGHRWLAVADDKDPWIVHNLPPTKETRRSTKGLVAKLTKDASVIKEVFITQREAMKEAQLSGPGGISVAISRKSLCHGHRYIMWEDCEEHLKDAYLEASELPEIPELKGVKVQRINALTGEVEDTYPTIEHVLRFFQMARGTLKRASDENRIEKGSKWKILYPNSIELN